MFDDRLIWKENSIVRCAASQIWMDVVFTFMVSAKYFIGYVPLEYVIGIESRVEFRFDFVYFLDSIFRRGG